MIILLPLLTFVVGINADCIPTPIPHTETGEDLYRALLADLARVYAEEVSYAADVQRNCTNFQNYDFFVQILITIVTDVEWLNSVVKGTITPTGTECVAVNTRIDFDLKQVAAHASTPIPGPSCDQLTGKARAQYLLQRNGATINALTAANTSGGASSTSSSYYGSPVPVGKWQKYVQDLINGFANVRPIIDKNDEANCLAATRTFGNGLKGLLESI